MHQTFSLYINKQEKIKFSDLAASKWIDRITELGNMIIYDHPWDGIFPIERFVRWGSLNS